jgi:hypothetical protein
MPVGYYRFICDVQERNQLVSERKILSVNRASGYQTWYTPTRYDDPFVAQRELALPSPMVPEYRVGPIPENLMPPLTIAPRRVAPAFGHPGGGVEIATRSPVWLFGAWSFTNYAFDSSI